MPESIATLIPHQGKMCLLEKIVRWDDREILLHTATHRSRENPLRNACGRLRALHLCEYGAQAMAVHGALTARASGTTARPGLLVSLRAVALHCVWIETVDSLLEVTATRLLAGAGGWQYRFGISAAAQLLAEGRAAVIARPQAAHRPA